VLVLSAAACATFLGMLPWSAFLWKLFPAADTAVQFPFRLGVVLTIAVAGLLGFALDACWGAGEVWRFSHPAMQLVLIAVAASGVGVLSWRSDWMWVTTLRSPPLVRAETMLDVDHTWHTYVPADHVAGFAKLIAAGDPGDRGLPVSVDAGAARLVEGTGTVSVVRQGPRRLLISYSVPAPARAQVGLLYSPLWRVESNGGSSQAAVLGSSEDGLIELPLLPDGHQLELVFDAGWPERYGMILTLASLVLILCALARERWMRTKPDEINDADAAPASNEKPNAPQTIAI
jgi:hypothetical protein